MQDVGAVLVADLELWTEGEERLHEVHFASLDGQVKRRQTRVRTDAGRSFLLYACVLEALLSSIDRERIESIVGKGIGGQTSVTLGHTGTQRDSQ